MLIGEDSEVEVELEEGGTLGHIAHDSPELAVLEATFAQAEDLEVVIGEVGADVTDVRLA